MITLGLCLIQAAMALLLTIAVGVLFNCLHSPVLWVCGGLLTCSWVGHGIVRVNR